MMHLFYLSWVPQRYLEYPGSPLIRVPLLSVHLCILSTSSLPVSLPWPSWPDLSQLDSMFTVAALPLSNLGYSSDSSLLIYCRINTTLKISYRLLLRLARTSFSSPSCSLCPPHSALQHMKCLSLTRIQLVISQLKAFKPDVFLCRIYSPNLFLSGCALFFFFSDTVLIPFLPLLTASLD